MIILSLSPIVAPLQSRADETTNISDVLGRTVRLNALCDDFEDPNWKYDRQNHLSSNEFWKGSAGQNKSDESDRGDPEILERVTPPHKGGISGSIGALKIGTNIPDNDTKPEQEDLRTAQFEEKLERKLTRTDQPVFVVHVWLPPFDKWGEYYSFGFRLEAQSNDTRKSYYPSIWLKYSHKIQGEIRIFLRIFDLEAIENDSSYEVYIGSIKQSGWWTLAIAFDKMGVCSYYARPGVDAPSEGNKIFDDTQFMIRYGKKALLMDHVNAGLFSLGYPKEGNTSPRFVIDDYGVWVIKDSK